MDKPGIEISEMEKMGWRTNPCCEEALVNVKLPQENLVGEEAKGFYPPILPKHEGPGNLGGDTRNP